MLKLMLPGKFMQAVIAANRALVESHCVSCGSWIAAGLQLRYLEIADSAHHCSGC
jgi:hypothetical protein